MWRYSKSDFYNDCELNTVAMITSSFYVVPIMHLYYNPMSAINIKLEDLWLFFFVLYAETIRPCLPPFQNFIFSSHLINVIFCFRFFFIRPSFSQFYISRKRNQLIFRRMFYCIIVIIYISPLYYYGPSFLFLNFFFLRFFFPESLFML